MWIEGLISGITGLILALVGYALMRMREKATSKFIKMALDQAEEITNAVVMAMEKAIVAEAKSALEDGEITSDEYTKMLEKAKEVALTTIYEKTWKPLTDLAGMTKHEALEYLDALIEKAVKDLKKKFN
jgi:hypothetical protein